MAVSVRMDPLLENELELAARRQGISKSQFIISAVERALGRRDPAGLYHQVMEESAGYAVGEGLVDEDLPARKSTLRSGLRATHERQQDEYANYLARREAGGKDQP